ncbi:MAG: HDOD domain-containing protein [Methylovulum sp.]|nr:MAG: HDOD domain-containing protein [Methylovulum sp.]
MSTLSYDDPEGSGPEIEFAYLSELPSLPALLIDALQQLDGNPEITTLVDKIGQDPPTVVRLLRIANSSFYGMSREIASLREAIVVLGFNCVRDLLVGICFSQMWSRQHNDFDYTKFWHHSMAVADCSRQLANYTGINPDIAFTAGLLHDIGQLVIVFLFPDAVSRIFNAQDARPPSGTQAPIAEKERRLLGFDHAYIGAKAARHWNFPVAIQKAIEQHETMPVAGAVKSLGVLIYSANLLMVDSMPWDDSAVQDREEALRITLDILGVSVDQALLSADAGRRFAERIIAAL